MDFETTKYTTAAADERGNIDWKKVDEELGINGIDNPDIELDIYVWTDDKDVSTTSAMDGPEHPVSKEFICESMCGEESGLVDAFFEWRSNYVASEPYLWVHFGRGWMCLGNAVPAKPAPPVFKHIEERWRKLDFPDPLQSSDGLSSTEGS